MSGEEERKEINAPTPGDINQVRQWLTDNKYTTDPFQAVHQLKELVEKHAKQTPEGLEIDEGYSEAFTKLTALINSFRFALEQGYVKQEFGEEDKASGSK
ncbi:hypothetical protein WALSEDRAFT_61181 [Wallemia mellicola CBS 633.66]|uniref:Uncharacterized protein n=1 Tax=Wallemia mellicola (strain ATCC MYA-4683 / CBS 633.66) TaxID=671144 RepID=I4Y7R3_WALMC|nr:hypothetical protein WALSEDRAFT_61181 [Wallemia mellicola CBS 633.66]EIM20005.1 hypothetical protein WALSEDRAFT_61181 [Wallemia mellicola CBS 633.66]|eukprot:XP_006959935.1 hypothetical protein WALSEDRAFT_61181 [Wallemia mellicola CBS 633.66]